MRAGPAALLAAALFLAACPTLGNHVPEAVARLSVSGDSLAPGDSLRLTAYLRNPADEPLRLEFTTRCQVEFYVLSPDQTPVHPVGGGTTCINAPSVLEIPAGDSVRFDDAWLVSSAPGSYTAYAVVWDHDAVRGDAREFKSSYRSNVHRVRITPE